MSRSMLQRGIVAPEPKSLRRVTEIPTTFPITVAEAKLHAHIDTSTDDADVTAWIQLATRTVEQFTRRTLITTVWRMTYDALPFDFFTIPAIPRIIRLFRPPIISLDEIEFVKEDDSTSLFTLSDLIVDTNSEPGRVSLRPGVEWPSGLRLIDAVRIKYTAGYGATGASVPEAFRTAIKRLVGTMAENREDIIIGQSVVDIPFGTKAILAPYQIQVL